MTIKGDMVAVLSNHDIEWGKAKRMVEELLECANGPDFAQRYAQDSEMADHQSLMVEYWRVIAFLKSMV